MSLGKLKALIFGMATVIVVLILILIFVPSNEEPQTDSGKLKVVASFFPLYDFTKNVAGDLVELEILFDQTPEVSSFTPSDVRKINDADVLIINGAGLEPILDDLLDASDNKKLHVVDTSSGIDTIRSMDSHTGSANPHVWLDPRNAIIQIINIRNGMIVMDVKNANIYAKNAQEYIEELKLLDNKIKESTDTFTSRDIVVFHSAFDYFANRYNLNQVAVFESTPGKETTPKELTEISNTVKELGIKALFSEPQFSPKIVETLAEDLNIQVRILNPIATGDLDSDSYISIMENNLRELESVLK